MSAAATPASPVDSGAPEHILGDDGGRAYRRFLEWTVGDGFALAVIEVRSPAQRRDLLTWTSAEMPGTRVVQLDRASGKPLRPLLEEACPSPGGSDILVLTRLEEAEDRIKLCARINIQRDELAKAFPVPWVVLVHPAAALEMQQHAADFSSFAGLWLNEERDESVMPAEDFDWLGRESMPLGARAMHASPDDGPSGHLGKAYAAIVLSNYDEAVDLLAQYDMHHPDAPEHDPRRIRLDGLLLWMRGQPAQALSRLEEARNRCQPPDTLLRVSLVGDIARIRAQHGEVDAALEVHRETLKTYEALGNRYGRAVTLGDIARLLAAKGEVDAALKMHTEALDIYEALGARRERAVTLVDIARLLTTKGEVDAALDLQKKALKIDEDLGDADGVASTRWSMGRIALQQGNTSAAFDHMSTSYTMNRKLGRLDAICVVGVDLAKLLLASGHRADAMPILTRSLAGFLRLGRRDDAQHVQQLIDSAADEVSDRPRPSS